MADLPANVTKKRGRAKFVIGRCDALGHTLHLGGACERCLAGAMKRSLMLEREECARLAEACGEVGKQIAGAIRARGAQ